MRPSTSRRRPLLGFTLTELVVTLVVLGLLASVAAISYDGIIEDSRYATLEREAAEFDRHYRGKLAFGLGEPGFDPQTAAATIAGEIITDSDLAGVASYSDGLVEFTRGGVSVCLALSSDHGVSGTISRGECGDPLSLSYASTTFAADGSAQVLTASPSGGNGSYSYSLSGDSLAGTGISFNTTTGTFSTGGITSPSTGLYDSTFNTASGFNAPAHAVAHQADGKVIVAGEFTEYDGTARLRVARLNTDGSLDETFGTTTNGPNAVVRAVAVQSNGQIVIAGDFTDVGGTARLRVARLNSDGSLDGTFGTTTNGPAGAVHAIAIDGDGKVVIGGNFTSVGGTTRTRVARLNTDGSLDTTSWSTTVGPRATVNAVAVAPSGYILVGGAFTPSGAFARENLARLNTNGTLHSWELSASGVVRAITFQPDGKFVVAGDFTSIVSGSGAFDIAVGIARFTTGGELDLGPEGFYCWSCSGIDATLVRAVTVQSDGKIVIAGDFSNAGSVTRLRVARIAFPADNLAPGNDGTFGTTTSGPNASVRALSIDAGGKVVAVGDFTSVGGNTAQRVVRFGNAPTGFPLNVTVTVTSNGNTFSLPVTITAS